MASSSSSLVAFLRDLKYEHSGQLVPANFDAAFNDPNLRKFLEFFLKRISKEKNFVSDQEMKMFQKLKAEGRIIIDRKERQLRLQEKEQLSNSNSSTAYNDDQATLDWYTNRLTAARTRLENLKQLEQRMDRVWKQKKEEEEKKSKQAAQVAMTARRQLKQTQIESMGLNVQFGDHSKNLSNTLIRFQPLFRDQYSLSAAFFSVVGAGQCLSSIEKGLRNVHSIRQQLAEYLDTATSPDVDSTVNTGSGGMLALDTGSDGTLTVNSRSDGPFAYLRDALYVAFRQKCVEEIRLADAKARLEYLGRLQKQTDRGFISNGNETVVDLRQRITSFIEGSLDKYAVTAAESVIGKAIRVRVQTDIERAKLCIEKENQLLDILKKQLLELSLLSELITAEKHHVQEYGLEPLLGIHKLLNYRVTCEYEREDRLKQIVSSKRRNSQHCDDDGNHSIPYVSTANGTNDTVRAQAILALSRTHARAVETGRNLCAGISDLDEQLAHHHHHRFTSMESTVLNLMKEYERKNKGS